MASPTDPNAHTTISKLRSRFSGLGKPKSSSSNASDTAEAKQHGIDYSPAARNLEVKTNLRQLYPPIEPFKGGMLKVDDRHEIYWEACGKEDGVPGE